MGGVIVGHEMGRSLGVPAMFLERPTGTFELRRGFRIDPGTRVLMMEDVVTTGLSSREAIAAIQAAGGEVVAAASLVDRSNGAADLGVPFLPLIRLDVPSYLVKAGDLIRVKNRAKSLQLVHSALSDSRRDVPDFLTRVDGPIPEGRVDRLPSAEDVSIPVQANLIIELCSK
jgi:orotate phosphoribosyltransferase